MILSNYINMQKVRKCLICGVHIDENKYCSEHNINNTIYNIENIEDDTIILETAKNLFLKIDKTFDLSFIDEIIEEKQKNEFVEFNETLQISNNYIIINESYCIGKTASECNDYKQAILDFKNATVKIFKSKVSLDNLYINPNYYLNGKLYLKDVPTLLEINKNLISLDFNKRSWVVGINDPYQIFDPKLKKSINIDDFLDDFLDDPHEEFLDDYLEELKSFYISYDEFHKTQNKLEKIYFEN